MEKNDDLKYMIDYILENHKNNVLQEKWHLIIPSLFQLPRLRECAQWYKEQLLVTLLNKLNLTLADIGVKAFKGYFYFWYFGSGVNLSLTVNDNLVLSTYTDVKKVPKEMFTIITPEPDDPQLSFYGDWLAEKKSIKLHWDTICAEHRKVWGIKIPQLDNAYVYLWGE